MTFHDKNGKYIKDDDLILFTHEDSVEPSGESKYASLVKLCFWSDIEKRYIPFSEVYDSAPVKSGEIINFQRPK